MLSITNILEQTVAFQREHGHWPARAYLSRETVNDSFLFGPVDPEETRFGSCALGVTDWLFDDTLARDVLRLE